MSKVAREYYKGGFKAILGGAPVRVSFKLSQAALASMSATQRMSSAYDQRYDDDVAVRYACWLAARDGIAVPTVTALSKSSSGVRVVVERGIPSGAPCSNRAMRAKAVRFEKVTYNPGMNRGTWKRPRWSEARQDVDAVLLQIDIPHWDHIPICVEVSV